MFGHVLRGEFDHVVTDHVAADSTTPYTDVDSWSLTHRFTDNGDDSSTLWLSEIVHTGKAGDGADMKLPPVQQIRPPRVDRFHHPVQVTS